MTEPKSYLKAEIDAFATRLTVRLGCLMAVEIAIVVIVVKLMCVGR
jgi:hypothetical protein